MSQLAGPFHVHPFVGRKINKIWIPWNTSRLRLHYDERNCLTLRNHATWRWPHQMNSFVQLLLYTLGHGNEQSHWQIICQRKFGTFIYRLTLDFPLPCFITIAGRFLLPMVPTRSCRMGSTMHPPNWMVWRSVSSNSIVLFDHVLSLFQQKKPWDFFNFYPKLVILLKGTRHTFLDIRGSVKRFDPWGDIRPGLY